MTGFQFSIFVPTLMVMVSLWAGCGHKEGDGHDHGKSEHGKEDGHGHGEESPSGAAFKAGKGVTLTTQTRDILGVTVADVAERELPRRIRFTVQVFGEKHHHGLNLEDHTGCDFHGSGFLSTNVAASVKTGQPVQILRGTNAVLAGAVVGIQKGLALGESEVVVALSNGPAVLKPGEFLPAIMNLPRNEPVVAIPASALLRTAEGTFVYAVNGDAYLRTPVKVGTQADGWVEISDGLLAGDQVVTKRVEDLWLIELRATKGGGHSH